MTPHFSDDELRCRCGCGRMEMDPGFMDKLEALRVQFGKPMVVSSAFRCPTHNAGVSSTGTEGPHTMGRAVDIRISGSRALELVGRACHFNATPGALVGSNWTQMTGIGIAQKGDHGARFIHLDDLGADETSRPRPWIWSY